MSRVAVVPLGEIARLQAGVGFPLDLQGRSHGDYPLAKVADISRGGRSGFSVLTTADHFVSKADLTVLRTAPVPRGSILFAKIGEAIRQNHRVVAGRDLLIDNNAMAAVPGPQIESRYLYHFLKQVDFYCLASATTVPALRKSELEKIGVPLPSLPEQRRIAEVLDRAEALRAKRRVALTEVDGLAHAIFNDMFGDPTTNPKAWDISALRRIATTTSGGTPDRSVAEYFGGEIPWVKSGELHDGVVTATEECLTERGVRESSAKLLPAGTVLVAMYGATAGVVARLGIDATTNQAICCILPQGSLGPTYLLHLLKQLTPSLLAKRVGGAQPNLSQALIRNLQVPLPPLDLQRQFAHRISAVERLEEAQVASQRELDALFAALQHRAFRGEL